MVCSITLAYNGVLNYACMRRYAPLMRPAGSWWRWLSSLLVQDSFAHLAANSLLLGGLGLHLERRYGTARIFALALLAGVAGNFFDSLLMVCTSSFLLGCGLLMPMHPQWHTYCPCVATLRSGQTAQQQVPWLVWHLQWLEP